MKFDEALSHLFNGKRLQRRGWNGKGMFVFMVNGSKFQVNRPPLNEFFSEGTEIEYIPHLDMKTADGKVMTWTPSDLDIFSEDWEVLEETDNNVFSVDIGDFQ